MRKIYTIITIIIIILTVSYTVTNYLLVKENSDNKKVIRKLEKENKELNSKIEELNKSAEDLVIDEISYNEFNVKLLDKRDFVVVYVQTGCSHCHDYLPRIQKVVNDNKLDFIYKLDLLNQSKEDYNIVVNTLGIEYTPTTCIYLKGEKVVCEVGVLEEKNIIGLFVNNNIMKEK